MTPITYVGDAETSNETLAALTNGSRWANAITKDGSMWVWIPRYAYRITSGYHTRNAGNIEIAFVDTENNFLDKSLRGQTILTSGVTDETYTTSNVWILEPAFEFRDEHLTGFWTAKFEASNMDGYGDYFATANSTNLTLQVKPNVTSWRSITALNIFTVCQELKSQNNYGKYFNSIANVDTHMMKNVEWGATAYLAHSKYGLNGEKLCINTNDSYITGMGSGSTSSADSASNEYNTVIGKKSSTTNNIYGIYDMSGGAWDNVSACYDGYTNVLTSNTEEAYIEKYIDIYTDYSISKYGDALYETSDVSSGNWFGDHCAIVTSTNPLYVRGGWRGYRTSTGLFAYWYTSGMGTSSIGFRPTIVVTEE